MGITFTVYSEGENIDRAWPYDIIPRIIAAPRMAPRRCRAAAAPEGAQPVHRRYLRRAGRDLTTACSRAPCLENSANFRKECVGVRPPHGRVGPHLRLGPGARPRRHASYVLEDNLRVPSGVSYMIENRVRHQAGVPELFEHHRIQPVDDYPSKLFDMLAALSPAPWTTPRWWC
jgi:uncharacterized circularly permuted ATP-grasp superfamily protein